jgi:hypothetical protein
MVSGDIQRIYDEYVACLPEGERLRLVELITRGMATPGLSCAVEQPAVAAAIREVAGWQPTDRREANHEWRDRAL